MTALGPNHASQVTGLDHVGFIVVDLEAACSLLGQLGFRLTARADHTRTDASGHAVPAGSSQRSAMFRRGYVEVMQITDPDAGHQLSAAIRVRHGLHVVALGTDDAAACHAACLRQGVAAGPLQNWSRPVRDGTMQGVARFSYFDSRWNPHDPSYICWVQHRTPELLRPTGVMDHDNGALCLLGVQYRGPRSLAEEWAAQLRAAGATSRSERAGGFTLGFSEARLDIDVDDNMDTVLPTAVLVEFADMEWLRQRCAALGIAVRTQAAGALEVDLQQVFGLRWLCMPAGASGSRV